MEEAGKAESHSKRDRILLRWLYGGVLVLLLLVVYATYRTYTRFTEASESAREWAASRPCTACAIPSAA